MHRGQRQRLGRYMPKIRISYIVQGNGSGASARNLIRVTFTDRFGGEEERRLCTVGSVDSIDGADNAGWKATHAGRDNGPERLEERFDGAGGSRMSTMDDCGREL